MVVIDYLWNNIQVRIKDEKNIRVFAVGAVFAGGSPYNVEGRPNANVPGYRV